MAENEAPHVLAHPSQVKLPCLPGDGRGSPRLERKKDIHGKSSSPHFPWWQMAKLMDLKMQPERYMQN
jgi:hypothetical protein